MTDDAGVKYTSSHAQRRRRTVIVLVVGVVAVALIAAGVVIATRQDPDVSRAGRFAAVRVTVDVPISEYEQQPAVTAPAAMGSGTLKRAGLPAAPLRELSGYGVRHLADPTDDTESGPDDEPTAQTNPQPTTTAEPTSTSTATSTATATSTSSKPSTPSTATTSSTPSPPTTSSVPAPSSLDPDSYAPISEETDLGTVQLISEDDVAEAVVQYLFVTSSTPLSDPQASTNLEMLLAVHMQDPAGRRVEPAVAAQRTAELLRKSRLVAKSGPAPVQEPVGVEVAAELELAGLRGTPVLVTYSMWRADDGSPVYADWLNTNVAYRLTPTTDDDNATVSLWVPLPDLPGPYHVRLALTADGRMIAEEATDEFG
jgi:hypothetical protein